MIKVPVTFDTANRKKDRSIRCSFTTNLELSTDEYAELDKLVLSSGWLLFAPTEIDETNVPPEPAGLKEGKPKIQRLRGVAWFLYQKSDQSLPFEVYWDSFFERILDHYKEQLD